jgi:DNA primase large subunit
MNIHPMTRANATWTTKYPFTEEARDYIRTHAPPLQELGEEELRYMVEYAYYKLKETITGEKSQRWTRELEALSYPLEFALVKATGDPALQRSFAVREAKRVQKHLVEEDPEEIVHIGRDTFHLRLTYSKEEGRFLLHYLDYIKTATRFASLRWKLVNRYVAEGLVRLDKRSASRIISEHVKEYIQGKMGEEATLPKVFHEYAAKLQELYKEKRWEGRAPEEVEAPKRAEDYPPCMKEIYTTALRGESLPHTARFTIVTFLHEIGRTTEEIIQVLSGPPDYNPEKTRYQVEHITGKRSGRKTYKVPSCATLRTLDLCRPDRRCEGIRHPLQYTRRRKR